MNWYHYILTPLILATLVVLSPFLLVMSLMDYFACRGNEWCRQFLYGNQQLEDGEVAESVYLRRL